MKLKVDEKQLRSSLNQLAGKFAFNLHKELIKNIPKRFRNRIVVKKGDNWRVGTNDEIFKYWEYGTKAHDIEARFSNALKFKWDNYPPTLPPSPDGFHYFKKVRHPGTKGHKVLEKMTKDKRLLKKLLKKSLS